MAKFCVSCGEKLPPLEKLAFCPSCGKAVAGSGEAADQAIGRETTPANAAKPKPPTRPRKRPTHRRRPIARQKPADRKPLNLLPLGIVATVAGLAMLVAGVATAFSDPPREDTSDLATAVGELEQSCEALETELQSLRDAAAQYAGKTQQTTEANRQTADKLAQVKAEYAQRRQERQEELSKVQGDLDKTRRRVRGEVEEARRLALEQRTAAVRDAHFKRMLQRYKPAVVTLANSEGVVATGFLVSDVGQRFLISTSALVDAQARYAAKFNLPTRRGGPPKAVALPLDLFARTSSGAAIFVAGPGYRFPRIDCFQLGRMQPGRSGDPVVAIVSQVLGDQLLEHSILDGDISAASRVEDGGTYMQTTIPLNAGAAGAPILDRRGRLVGMLLKRMQGMARTSLAVPGEELRAALRGR